MRFFCSLLLVGAFASTFCIGQTSQYDSTQFYSVYKNSLMIDALVKQTGSSYEGALEQAKIGNHQAAVALWDENPLPQDILTREDSARLLAFVPTDARDFILKAAENRRVIVINEAVYNQAHRAFVESLLPALHKQGFTHLAIEWLSPYDTDFASRKYALRAGISGTYTDAPMAAELLKTAVREGFTLLPYPAPQPCTNMTPEACAQTREPQQAQAIANLLAADSATKIVILCTFGHVDERKSLEIRQMGSWIAELAQADPLTIDQETMSPHSSPQAEDPYYTLFANKIPVKRASILIKDGISFIREAGYTDIVVFHPRPKYTNHRPDYLIFANDRKRWTIPPAARLKPNHLYLAMAYSQGVDAFFGVPDDIVEIADVTKKYDLCLKPGNYTVQIVGEDGKVVQILKAEVK